MDQPTVKSHATTTHTRKTTTPPAIITTYTVQELALLLKALRQTGHIKNKNITQMLNLIITFIRTKHQTTISHKSLYNSFYSIEQATIKSLINKQQELLNTLHKIKRELK